MTPIVFSKKYLAGLKSTGFILGSVRFPLDKFLVYRDIITGELVAMSTINYGRGYPSCFGYRVDPADFSVALKTDGVLSYGKA